MKLEVGSSTCLEKSKEEECVGEVDLTSKAVDVVNSKKKNQWHNSKARKTSQGK